MTDPKTFHIKLDPDTLAFYRAAAHRASKMTTVLRRVTHAGQPGIEYEAICVDTSLPRGIELVVGSEIGFMDAIHRLKTGLREFGMSDALTISNIERYVYVLDD